MSIAEKETNLSPVYQHEIVEFVTVAVRYCSYLENLSDVNRGDFVDTMTKLLPLLYLKGALLPQFLHDEDVVTESFVTEDIYDAIRNDIASLMATYDDYLDVFVEDMKYSDTPILQTISESLADIYQDLRNCCEAYKSGDESLMTEAIATCSESYLYYWGQRAVNALRALHDIKAHATNDTEEEYHD